MITDNNDELLRAVEAAKMVVKVLLNQIERFQTDCLHPEAARRIRHPENYHWCRRCHKRLS